jgi:hypothetical protein
MWLCVRFQSLKVSNTCLERLCSIIYRIYKTNYYVAPPLLSSSASSTSGWEWQQQLFLAVERSMREGSAIFFLQQARLSLSFFGIAPWCGCGYGCGFSLRALWRWHITASIVRNRWRIFCMHVPNVYSGLFFLQRPRFAPVYEWI